MVLIQTPPSSFETQLHEPTRAIEHLLPGLCIDFCKKRKIKNGNNAYACDYPSRRQNLLLSFFLSFFIFVHSLLSPVVPRLFERSSRFFLSLIFVYFLLFVDLFADLCSIFFVLFLSSFLFVSLARCLARFRVSPASRIDASSLELFFFPAQLNSMPLILFKLQSSPPPPFLLSMEYL